MSPELVYFGKSLRLDFFPACENLTRVRTSSDEGHQTLLDQEMSHCQLTLGESAPQLG